MNPPLVAEYREREVVTLPLVVEYRVRGRDPAPGGGVPRRRDTGPRRGRGPVDSVSVQGGRQEATAEWVSPVVTHSGRDWGWEYAKIYDSEATMTAEG